MEIGVSVVIVTYNGKSRLSETLKHLALQQSVECPWEVLLIDNNSTDGTAQFAKEYWEGLVSNISLRIILEMIAITKTLIFFIVAKSDGSINLSEKKPSVIPTAPNAPRPINHKRYSFGPKKFSFLITIIVDIITN